MRSVVLLAVLCPTIARADVDARGRFTTRVPFEVPSFYGIAPSVGLVYTGGPSGDAGAGWNVDAGSVITRTSAMRGTPRFDATDAFWLDGQELIPCAPDSTSPSCSTAREARLAGSFYSTRIESFMRAQRDGERWTVWSPNGVRREYDSGNGGVSYQLSAVIDTHGNRVHYTWACPSHACLLVMIDYGKARDAHPGVEIDLLYEARPDVRTSSTGLGRAVHDQRLRTVAVRGDGHLARAYKLSYVLSPETGASLLASVQQFASDASVDGAGTITLGATPPLPAITLTTESMLRGRGAWAPHGEAQGMIVEDPPAGQLHHYPPQTELGTESSSAAKPLFPSGVLVGDFDGDRRSEALAWGMTNHCTTLELGVRLSSATDVGPLVTTTFGGVHGSTVNCHPRAFAGDFDGDGREDVAIGAWPLLMVVYGRPDGHFAWGGTTTWSDATRDCGTGDVDGDGREDLVCRITPEIVTYFGKTMLATPMAVEPPVEDGATDHFAIADIDGDGLADVVLAGLDFDHARAVIAVGLSQGHGYAWELDTAPSLPPDYRLVVPDLDGDGRADVALLVGNSIYEGLSRPTASRFEWQPPYVPQVSDPRFADLNGDGRADLVGDSPPRFRDLSYQLRLPGGGYAEMVQGRAMCPGYAIDPLTMTGDLDGDGFTDSLCISQEVAKGPPEGGEQVSIARYRVNDRRSVDAALNRHRWMRVDVDGDGALELVNISYANPGYTVHVVWPQAGYETAYTVAPGYSPLALGDLFGLTEPNTGRWIPMEAGGPAGPADGKTDLVLVEPAAGNTVMITTLLSLGGGQFLPVQSVVAVDDPRISDIGVQDGVNIPGWMPADLDGDDWSDLVRIRPNRVGSGGGGAVIDTLHAVGGGYFEGESHAVVHFVNAIGTTARWFQPTDVDGDGRTDFVHVATDPSGALEIHALRARGDGGFDELASTPGLDAIAPASWRLVDLDGDGIVDLVHAMRDPAAGGQCLRIDALVGDGNGRFVLPSAGSACVDAGVWPRLFDESRNVTAVDLDDDGRSELVHVTHLDNRLVVTRLWSAGGGWHAEPTAFSLNGDLGNAWAWNPSSDPVTGFTGLWYGDGTGFESLRWERTRDELIAIDNGIGLHTDIEYQTGGSIVAGRGSLPAGMIPRLVRRVAISDTVSSTGDFASYAYNTPAWSSRDRQLIGFASRTISTPRNSTSEAFAVDDACRSRSIMRSTYDLSHALLTQVATEYEPLAAAPPFRCVVTRVARTECESDGCRSGEDAWFRTTAEGNVDVSSSTTDSGPFMETESWFARNAKAYILDRFTRSFTLGWDPIGWWSEIDWRERLYEPGDTGDVKTEIAFATDHATSYVTTYTHDEHGNVTDVVSPGGKHTHLDYDKTYGRYAIRACIGDGPQLCTSTTWDDTLGVVASTTDANNATTATHRDPHGRVDDVTGPGGHAHTDYADSGTPSQRITTKVDDGSPGDHVLVTDTYYDGSGRTHRTTHEGGATVSTIYSDSSSRPAQISEVHDASALPRLFTTFSYDALGRPLSVVHPDGTHVDSSYQRGRVTVKDELGHVQRRHLDGRGAVIAVDEIVTDHDTPVTRTTTYRNEITGRLLEIWDPAGNLTTFEYDAGRLVATTDPDRGRRTYAYEPDGELEHVTDALGNTITYEHDELGHTTSRTDADKQGNVERHIDWHYDNAGAVHGSSKGRVYRIDDAQSSGAGTTMSTDVWYDEAGRVIDSSTCVSGRCFDLHRHFDPAGRIDYVVYPNAAGSTTGPGAETVTYTYDPTGTLHSLGPYATYTYELDGRVKTATFGNGAKTTYTYHPARRWTEHIDLDGPARQLLHLGYEHDATGRITRQLGSGVQSTDLIYHYDELGRLTEVMSNDGVRDEYVHYDAIGRIHDTNRLGVLRYDDPLHLHGATSTTAGSQRAYDANGNATTIVDGTRRSLAATWTIDGHIADVTTTATGDRYAYGYDAGGRRVEKTGPAGTTRYFGPELELDPSGKLVKYYSANGALVARNDGAVYYFHSDIAHATRLETGAKAKLANSYEYWAFGEPYRTTEAADHDIGFSGARTDDAVDLVTMGARTYDPVFGRFLSADSVIPDPYRPQSLDRYSYVENDPVNHYDPSGHMRADIEVMKDRKQQLRALWILSVQGANCSMFTFCDPDTTGASFVTQGRNAWQRGIMGVWYSPSKGVWTYEEFNPHNGATVGKWTLTPVDAFARLAAWATRQTETSQRLMDRVSAIAPWSHAVQDTSVRPSSRSSSGGNSGSPLGFLASLALQASPDFDKKIEAIKRSNLTLPGRPPTDAEIRSQNEAPSWWDPSTYALQQAQDLSDLWDRNVAPVLVEAVKFVATAMLTGPLGEAAAEATALPEIEIIEQVHFGIEVHEFRHNLVEREPDVMEFVRALMAPEPPYTFPVTAH